MSGGTYVPSGCSGVAKTTLVEYIPYRKLLYFLKIKLIPVWRGSLCKHALKFGRYRELRTAWNMHGPRFAVRYLRATW